MRQADHEGEPVEGSNRNVALYRAIIAGFNERGIEGVLPYYDEDVQVYDPDLPDGGTYRGREGVREILEHLVGGFEELTIRDWELIPAGDRVVGLIHTHGRGGRRSGLEIELRDAHTLTFRDGKVVYWRLYLDRTEALTDAGLDPEEARLS